MKNHSFSQETKSFLREQPLKKNCCRKIFDTASCLPDDEDGVVAFSALKEMLRCQNCAGVLIRALFIRFGSATDPAKQYHLEFSFKAEALADAVELFLCEQGIPPKRTARKGKYIAYYKETAQIEDLLALIGATGAVFEVMNGKIVKEMRNSVNRQVNCDTHNINATLRAAAEQQRLIRILEANGKLKTLPAEYQETAKLRLENPQANMTELGLLHNPAISKSGVNHRLQKMMELAKEAETEKII